MSDLLKEYPANYSTIEPIPSQNINEPIHAAQLLDGTALGFTAYRFDDKAITDDNLQGIVFHSTVFENPKQHDKEFLVLMSEIHGRNIFEQAMKEYQENPEFKDLVEGDTLKEHLDESQLLKEPEVPNFNDSESTLSEKLKLEIDLSNINFHAQKKYGTAVTKSKLIL